MMHGLINQGTTLYVVGVAIVLASLGLAVWTFLRYRTLEARRRAAGPLQVVAPRPTRHNEDLLGIEFIVFVDDFLP